MSNRKNPPTSIAAHRQANELKSEHYEKIIKALRKIRAGGIYTEIATISGMRPDQVGRRLSEMEAAQVVFKVGNTRPTPAKRQAAVYQLYQEYLSGEKELSEKKEKQSTAVNPLFDGIN